MRSGKVTRAVRKPLTISECELIVNHANSLSSDEILKNENSRIDCSSCSFSVRCSNGADITSSLKGQLLSILENNMKSLYEKSSWGWNEESKRKELFATESRLIICSKNPEPTPDSENCDSEARDPCAFVHFRFEVDDKRPVLYCYEIQLLEHVRGIKLGQKLLEILYQIASDNQMTRVMLTVFKFNSNAYRFFAKNGFRVDATDPSKFGKFTDYFIMSRRP